MKFADGLAGAGGFRIPLEKLGHKCVWACENDKYARQVYRYHWEEPIAKDIRKVDTKGIPDFDLFVAGFPCQAFSIAGQRKGFTDTRGALFFEIRRILRDKRPKMVLLENVKGLLSHDNYRTFRIILESLRNLGYMGQYQVLNSKNFGVPQNRERVFIVGYLGKGPRPEIFPIRENGNISEKKNGAIRRQTQTQVVSALRKGDYQMKADNNYIIINPQLRNETTPSIQKARENGLPDPCGHGQLSRDDGLTYTLDRSKVQIILTDNLGGNIKNRIKNADESPSWCLGGSKTNIMDSNSIRRLTPLECERLQGFPDHWTKYGITTEGEKIEISDTQRYKLMGNAVTVPVVEAIAKRL